MLFRTTLALGSAVTLFGSQVAAVDKTVDNELDGQLKGSATFLDREALLPDDSDWVYDFTKNPLATWAPGAVLNANAATFPASAGLGITVAQLNLGPCSMLAPHIHPRATNFVTSVNGTVRTYMISENGARTVNTTLTPGKLTIFPQGSLHTMQNLDCTNTQLISALNSDDPGTHNMANGLFSLSDNFLEAAFGGSIHKLGVIRKNTQPVGTGAIYGDKACLAKCRAKGYRL